MADESSSNGTTEAAITPESLALKILQEGALSLGQLARKLPAGRYDGQTNPSTLWRWCHRGLRSKSGRIVKLQYAMVGGRALSSIPRLAFFSAQLEDTNSAQPESTTPAPTATPKTRTPTRRARDAKRAGEQCEKLGI